MGWKLKQQITALLAVVLLSVPTVSGQSKTAAPKTADLDQLLASIALYPDSLLAQMLVCATKPGDVVALNGWLKTTTRLKGSELQDAAVAAGFEPSFVAMVLFPSTIKMMAEQIDWTTKVGQAFLANRSSVFDSIQRLRAKAQQAGNLKTTAQQEVETRTTSSGQEVIVIEPTNPQVVYVPQYNPQVVYVPTTSTTTVVVQESNSSADAAAAGMIGFAAGIAIGASMDNDYYYGPYGWHGGGYMYNDAWDDYYDHREDAREDWADHRGDMAEERGDRRENTQEQRTERQGNRQENRPETTQAQRDQAKASAQQRRSSTQSATPQTQGASQQSRGYSGSTNRTTTRSGGGSDAFSGYSSGKSQRAASSRGQSSRSSSRSSGGRRR